jgi:hypothetical protein
MPIDRTELDALNQEVKEHSEWIAAHDARGEALWDEQRRTNLAQAQVLEKLSDKVGAMQTKLAYITGFAAVLGAVLGTLLAKVF